jgi:NRPS condensation-like uncharacterized protein
MVDDLPVQIIHESIDFDIEEKDADETDLDKLMTTFIKPFDLSKTPLLRVQIVRLSSKKLLLMLDMHHIISDGASLNIILREITELLKGNTLPEPKIQYKDFAVWQNEFFKSEVMRKQEAYWLNRLSGEIPVLKMPLDFERPVNRSLKGNTLYYNINKELTKKIKSLAIQTETTIYMIMMLAYSISLSKYTKQEDIIIGIAVEGRNHPDLRDIVGLFATTPVVRHYLEGEKTIRALLDEVKEELLNVYENQDYPFEFLVEKLQLRRSDNKNPLFSTLFSMHNVNISSLTNDENVLELYK